MARWIKANGTVQPIQPTNGTEFSLDEMRACVGGHLEAVKLTSKEVMYVNEEGVLLQLPLNTTATEVMHQHRPDRAHESICGDVLIASLVETGDEDDTLHVHVTPTEAACTECGKSPSLQWDLYGMTGTLCRACLERDMGDIKQALQSQQEGDGEERDGKMLDRLEDRWIKDTCITGQVKYVKMFNSSGVLEVHGIDYTFEGGGIAYMLENDQGAIEPYGESLIERKFYNYAEVAHYLYEESHGQE